MDRARFIESAPKYYAAALVLYVAGSRSSVSIDQICNNYFRRDGETLESQFRIKEGRLLAVVIGRLVADSVIVFELDDFGPPIIAISPTFEEDRLDNWLGSDIYFKAKRVGLDWLNSALDNLAEKETELRITDDDYDNPASEWSPLPLDRNESELVEVMHALSDATEKIRADNGYASEHPEERKYVLDGLQILQKHLSEAATISLPYIRQYAIEPAWRGMRTLGKSITGVALEVFKAKLKDWIVKHTGAWPFPWI